MILLNGASDSDILERKLFSDWVLGIGDGTIGENNDVGIWLDIPSDLLISSNDDSFASIVESTYPKILESMSRAVKWAGPAQATSAQWACSYKWVGVGRRTWFMGY